MKHIYQYVFVFLNKHEEDVYQLTKTSIFVTTADRVKRKQGFNENLIRISLQFSNGLFQNRYDRRQKLKYSCLQQNNDKTDSIQFINMGH